MTTDLKMHWVSSLRGLLQPEDRLSHDELHLALACACSLPEIA